MKKPIVDPNEAPEGYEARLAASVACNGCAFFLSYSEEHGARCVKPSGWPFCMSDLRNDRREVVFVERTGPVRLPNEED